VGETNQARVVFASFDDAMREEYRGAPFPVRQAVQIRGNLFFTPGNLQPLYHGGWCNPRKRSMIRLMNRSVI